MWNIFWPLDNQEILPMLDMPHIIPLPQKRPDLDIGVVFTYERDLMPPLLSSLKESGNGLCMRLMLVDNCSEGSVESYQEYFPDTVVLKNTARLHYAANLNLVLRGSTAKYILLLNTDMIFDPEEQCLTRMVAFMNSHPDCGIAGCRLYRADGRFAYPARRFQTMPMILARRLGIGKLFKGTLDYYLHREHLRSYFRWLWKWGFTPERYATPPAARRIAG